MDFNLQSKHLAPQKREFVKDGTIDGRPTRLTLTARWGLDNRRHELSLMLAWARPNGHGGWETTSYGAAGLETVCEFWPEYACAVAYHNCSLNGPLHYVANTVFLAGNRDCYGLEPGEQRRSKAGNLQWVVDTKGLFRVVERAEPPAPLELKYEPLPVERPMSWGPNAGRKVGEQQQDEKGLLLWYVPGENFPLERTMLKPDSRTYKFAPFLGEGKARDFAAARRIAIWPDATDEELSAPAEQLTAALEARLPTVLAGLKAAVESFGMTF